MRSRKKAPWTEIPAVPPGLIHTLRMRNNLLSLTKKIIGITHFLSVTTEIHS